MLCAIPGAGVCHDMRSTSVEIRSFRSRLFASRAGVHVNFHANRHFNDSWSLPSHPRSPCQRATLCRPRNEDRAAPNIAQAGMFMRDVRTGLRTASLARTRHSAMTAAGIIDRTNQMPRGTNIKSSTTPRTGIKSGIRSRGESAYPATAMARTLAYQGTWGLWAARQIA